MDDNLLTKHVAAWLVFNTNYLIYSKDAEFYTVALLELRDCGMGNSKIISVEESNFSA